MPRILVVDDEELIRRALQGFLTRMGHQVVLAPGGSEAIGILTSDPAIDLLITDMKMPHVSGLDILRDMNLRRDPRPVIVLTGVLNEAEDQAALISLGVSDDAIFYKPVDLFVILDAVKRKLGGCNA